MATDQPRKTRKRCPYCNSLYTPTKDVYLLPGDIQVKKTDAPPNAVAVDQHIATCASEQGGHVNPVTTERL
jgi:hypothetical protein